MLFAGLPNRGSEWKLFSACVQLLINKLSKLLWNQYEIAVLCLCPKWKLSSPTVRWVWRGLDHFAYASSSSSSIHSLTQYWCWTQTDSRLLVYVMHLKKKNLLCCSNLNSCIFVPVFEAGGWTKSRNVVRHKCSFQYKIVILHYLNHFNWVSHLKIEKRVVRTFSTIDRWHFLNIVLTNKNVKVSHTKETLQKQCKSVPSLSSRSLSYL